MKKLAHAIKQFKYILQKKKRWKMWVFRICNYLFVRSLALFFIKNYKNPKADSKCIIIVLNRFKKKKIMIRTALRLGWGLSGLVSLK